MALALVIGVGVIVFLLAVLWVATRASRHRVARVTPVARPPAVRPERVSDHPEWDQLVAGNPEAEKLVNDMLAARASLGAAIERMPLVLSGAFDSCPPHRVP